MLLFFFCLRDKDGDLEMAIKLRKFYYDEYIKEKIGKNKKK